MPSGLMLGGVILVILAALYLACQWAAKRRLSGPDRSADRVPQLDTAIEGFRPPSTAPNSWYGVSLIQRRPSRTAALLWQSGRQNGWLLAVLTLVGAVSVAVAVASGGNLTAAQVFLPMLASVCLFAISSLTFYGDSVKQRCVFLSDRGISPALVWATRVFPSLLSVLIIAASGWVAASLGGSHGSNFQFMALSIFGGFAVCQLVSQWSPRPILAFFAGPTVMYAIAMTMLPLVFAYDHLPWFLFAAFWVSVPLFLFASYKLTPLWMQGPIDRRYTLRCLGFLAAFVVLPYVLVLGGLWITMPKLDRQWQAHVMAFQFPQRPETQRPVENLLPAKSVIWRDGWQDSSIDPASRDERKRFELEMAETEHMGQHLSPNEVFKHMGCFRGSVTRAPGACYPYIVPNSVGFSQEEVDAYLQDLYERDIRAMKLLLKWSTMIRKESTFGSTNLRHLYENAEQTEATVATLIHEYIQAYELTPEIADLIARLPDDALVQKSRINGLINETRQMWQWEGRINVFDTSLGRAWPLGFGFEQEREKRLLERDVQTGIDYLKTDFKKESDISLATGRFQPGRDLGRLDYLFDEFSRRDRAVAKAREWAAKKNPETQQ